MNSQLMKGIYGDAHEPKQGPFGLMTGQVRPENILEKCGWYNCAGELLGWGDLSKDDFVRICAEIDQSELFIVLNYQASHAAFHRLAYELYAGHGRTGFVPHIESPGVGYMAKFARYIVMKGERLFVDNFGFCKGRDLISHRKLTFKPISREEAAKFIEDFAENRR